MISTEPVSLFMKGTPQLVMCGNSDRALRALQGADAPVTTVGRAARSGDPPGALGALRLADDSPDLHQGELIGGADIVEELRGERRAAAAARRRRSALEREATVKVATVSA